MAFSCKGTINLRNATENDRFRDCHAGSLLCDSAIGRRIAEGFRKLRWADSRRGKGKRGGLRIV